MPVTGNLLTVDRLNKAFRGVHALQDYRLALAPGEFLGIIGPNGAGKTTLFNLLTGLVKPTGGSIVFDGREISGYRADQIARLGIARTFQKIRLFQALTALQNVCVALQSQTRAALWEVLLSAPHFVAQEQALVARALQLLALVNLDTAAREPVLRLTYHQQRRLEIACACALAPRLLLLDEPTAGMNPVESEALICLVQEIRRQLDLTIILIEHNMQVIMRHCERVQALNYGKVIGEGTPDAIRDDPAVIEAYLGQAAPLSYAQER
jgi:branched-chain amino acid transport system ATP-binding protein